MAIRRTKLHSEVSTGTSQVTEKIPLSLPLLKGSIRLSFPSPLFMWYSQVRAPHPEIISLYTYLVCWLTLQLSMIDIVIRILHIL